MPSVGQQADCREGAAFIAPPVPPGKQGEDGVFGRANGGSTAGAQPLMISQALTDRAFARRPDRYQNQCDWPSLPLPVESLVQGGLPLSRSGELGSAANGIEATIRELLAQDRVLAARKLIHTLPSSHAGNARLRRLRHVLAEPVVRRTMRGRPGRSADIHWLRENAVTYAGKWVALADGDLLASDGSLRALRRRLKRLAPQAKPLFHHL